MPIPFPNPKPNQVQRHMEAQVVRLSEAFNRQVEERDDIQSDLEAAEMKRRQMVEKGSWNPNPNPGPSPNPNPKSTPHPNLDHRWRRAWRARGWSTSSRTVSGGQSSCG
eukprot:scaffold67818_cov69-Phaeocystis_antarctica.AAC.1